jgi:hypothetical protein
VVAALIPIFCEFGAPNILQSDNGREFANQVTIMICIFEFKTIIFSHMISVIPFLIHQVVTAVTKCWTNCRIVHGKPHHKA